MAYLYAKTAGKCVWLFFDKLMRYTPKVWVLPDLSLFLPLLCYYAYLLHYL